MGFLNALPFNGYKSALFFVALVLVHGLGAMDSLAPALVVSLVKWLNLGLAGAVIHKVSKLKAG